jgi:four helix bundle protein
MDTKIKSFTDLTAWREGHKFVLLIYRAVEKFPSGEKFGLSSQLSRAAVSITSNIAEGFSRNSSKEKIQFYYMSLGSLAEVQNQLLIAKDIKILDTKDFDILARKSVEVRMLISGLIKSAKLLTKH